MAEPRPRDVVNGPKKGREREMKLVVLSFARNGTMGLYNALKILGYHPCHMQTFLFGGASAIRGLATAVQATRFCDGKRYGRAEFDHWLGEFDSVTDITTFFLEELIEAYPDSKFLLTTREPESWKRSIKNTIEDTAKKQSTISSYILSFFHPFLWQMQNMSSTMGRFMWGGSYIGDDEELLRTYRRHNQLARALVPKDRFLEVKLEDGLGWEQICPFLEKEIPEVPYPRMNSAAEFQEIAETTIKPALIQAAINLFAVVTPIVGVGAWCFMRYKP